MRCVKKYGTIDARWQTYAMPEVVNAGFLMKPGDHLEHQEDVCNEPGSSRGGKSLWPSTLKEFARRLPDIRWMFTVRSSAIRRAKAPLLPWPIQRMQFVSSPLEATLHNFELHHNINGNSQYVQAFFEYLIATRKKIVVFDSNEKSPCKQRR